MMDEATLAQVRAADPLRSTWLTANAGSGKTRVLTDRVARLLLAGTAPERILCLTYTKAAATEMQNRLLARLGQWAMLPEPGLRAELARLGEGTAPDLRATRRLFARALEVERVQHPLHPLGEGAEEGPEHDADEHGEEPGPGLAVEVGGTSGSAGTVDGGDVVLPEVAGAFLQLVVDDDALLAAQLVDHALDLDRRHDGVRRAVQDQLRHVERAQQLHVLRSAGFRCGDEEDEVRTAVGGAEVDLRVESREAEARGGDGRGAAVRDRDAAREAGGRLGLAGERRLDEPVDGGGTAGVGDAAGEVGDHLGLVGAGRDVERDQLGRDDRFGHGGVLRFC